MSKQVSDGDRKLKRIIISADDFGLDDAVNEAVETACRDGLLTSASLMVGEGASIDAVARARNLPKLLVGLHIVLVEGHPVSSPDAIPDLVGPDGRFRNDMVAAGFRFFFLPHVRRQLAAEIRAQFEAFAATGLPLDHVNAHKHFHLHPTIARLIISIGRDFGLKAMRLPREPAIPLAAADGVQRDSPGRVALRVWTAQLKHVIDKAGLTSNDHVFGLAWSGGMTEERLNALIPHLPEGISEIYCHPATARTPLLIRAMPEYRHVDEFKALMSPSLRQRLDTAGIIRTSFSAISDASTEIAA